MSEDQGKTCTKCGVWKGFGEFNRRATSADGLQYKCRDCQAEYRAAWYATNRESEIAKVRAWQACHRDLVTAYAKASYGRRRGAHQAANREWKRNNPERHKELQRNWAARNPDCRRRAAAKAAATLSDGYIRSVIAAHGSGLKKSEIPTELVEFKREQLRLHRLLRDFEKVLNDEGESE